MFSDRLEQLADAPHTIGAEWLDEVTPHACYMIGSGGFHLWCEVGLEWNVALEAGGVVVGEKVKIVLEIEALKS